MSHASSMLAELIVPILTCRLPYTELQAVLPTSKGSSLSIAEDGIIAKSQ